MLSVILLVLAFLGLEWLPWVACIPALTLPAVSVAPLWPALPLLAYTVFRRYLQSMNVVRPAMIALVTAIVSDRELI